MTVLAFHSIDYPAQLQLMPSLIHRIPMTRMILGEGAIRVTRT